MSLNSSDAADSAQILDLISKVNSKQHPDPSDFNNGESGDIISEGMRSDVKKLYRTQRGAWTTQYPYYLDEAAETKETAKYAVLVRYENCNDGRQKLKMDSIVIQSPLLKQSLGTILKDYPGVIASLERLEFKSPFAPIIHRWHQLEEAESNEEPSETKNHLSCLMSTLRIELQATISITKDQIAHNVITYTNLWTLFEPGSLIFTTDKDQERVLKLRQVDPGEWRFRLYCIYVDWNGDRFGNVERQIDIPVFDDMALITSLPAYPLKHNSQCQDIEQRCVSRGTEFDKLRGYHFKMYNGVARSIDKHATKHRVDSRIIIDTSAFNLFNSNVEVRVDRLTDDKSYGNPERATTTNLKTLHLTPYQRLIATGLVRGYSLKDKTWFLFLIDHVRDIVWDNQAFDSLVIPNDTKSLLLAFADHQIKQKPTFDDVIYGKGKGIIILLSGPPGVGKTLTAESIAERIRVPLYTMSAADLGTSQSKFESSLNLILKMTTKWGAMLLLDEADVYLEARSTHGDLDRNKLVSIFLRVLEYHEGFLILTSNRVEVMDSAFESRIHLSLEYSPLSEEARLQVWQTFLDRASATEIATSFSKDDKIALAKLSLNGRQIKNIVKTAQLLATSKQETLSNDHVQVVLRLRTNLSSISLA